MFLCVREYTTGRKTGETRAFCHHSHTQRIGFLPERREWVKGARIKKKKLNFLKVLFLSFRRRMYVVLA